MEKHYTDFKGSIDPSFDSSHFTVFKDFIENKDHYMVQQKSTEKFLSFPGQEEPCVFSKVKISDRQACVKTEAGWAIWNFSSDGGYWAANGKLFKHVKWAEIYTHEDQ